MTTDSMERARRRATAWLWQMGYSANDVDNTGASEAAAEYIRSLVRDGDDHYLRELLVEHEAARILKLLSLIAQALDTGEQGDDAAIGAYLRNLAGTYLAPEVDMAIEQIREMAA